MSPTRSRHRRSSAQPPRTQNQKQSHGRSRTQGRGRNPEPEEGSLTGRELFRALNKASERGTQGKEMYVTIC
jgi:hypothetical protein